MTTAVKVHPECCVERKKTMCFYCRDGKCGAVKMPEFADRHGITKPILAECPVGGRNDRLR